MATTLRGRLLMPAAHLLNRLWPRSCWAELYVWAAGYPDSPLRRVSDCAAVGPGESCWCGKFCRYDEAKAPAPAEEGTTP